MSTDTVSLLKNNNEYYIFSKIILESKYRNTYWYLRNTLYWMKNKGTNYKETKSKEKSLENEITRRQKESQLTKPRTPPSSSETHEQEMGITPRKPGPHMTKADPWGKRNGLHPGRKSRIFRRLPEDYQENEHMCKDFDKEVRRTVRRLRR